jgi:hypothetical protein
MNVSNKFINLFVFENGVWISKQIKTYFICGEEELQQVFYYLLRLNCK